MGAIRFLLCAVVVVAAFAEITAALGSGRCPPPSKIHTYSKKATCKQDYDCKNGMVCCPNPANVKSCTYPDAYSGGGSGGNNRPSGGPGVYCEGVKCQPYEVCKPDPITKRLKCSRP
ncbi:hypothetical protein ABMA27_008997 [Loxostege sticticalis]|uniref:WAP domain-containing protein n=1 Tax=Loxostege sticticalis TaxID=481309 RepID=A0ABR3H9X8_LOXSC